MDGKFSDLDGEPRYVALLGPSGRTRFDRFLLAAKPSVLPADTGATCCQRGYGKIRLRLSPFESRRAPEVLLRQKPCGSSGL